MKRGTQVLFAITFAIFSIPFSCIAGKADSFSYLKVGVSPYSISKLLNQNGYSEFEQYKGYALSISTPFGPGNIDIGYERETDSSVIEFEYVYDSEFIKNIYYIGASGCFTDSEILWLYPGLRFGTYQSKVTTRYNGNRYENTKTYFMAALATRVQINITGKTSVFFDGSLKRVFADDPLDIVKFYAGIQHSFTLKTTN